MLHSAVIRQIMVSKPISENGGSIWTAHGSMTWGVQTSWLHMGQMVYQHLFRPLLNVLGRLDHGVTSVTEYTRDQALILIPKKYQYLSLLSHHLVNVPAPRFIRLEHHHRSEIQSKHPRICCCLWVPVLQQVPTLVTVPRLCQPHTWMGGAPDLRALRSVTSQSVHGLQSSVHGSSV